MVTTFAEANWSKGFLEGGAGRGNRTLLASLEDWNFTTKLYPRIGE
jgi:hypothetical protein